jgi:hypothetical protein
LHINNKPHPIFGSAIIPLITPTIEKKFRRKPKPFKYVILAEENKARRELLPRSNAEAQRTKTPNAKNKILRRHKHKKRRSHKTTSRAVQIRADPTGAEIKWDTMKAILELRQQHVIVDVIQLHVRRQKKKAF